MWPDLKFLGSFLFVGFFLGYLVVSVSVFVLRLNEWGVLSSVLG